MHFENKLEQLDYVKNLKEDIRDYPQIYRGSPKFVKSLKHKQLNLIVEAALGWLSPKHSYVSIDTRLSMLMTGMYPCIPGWHCDDFYRPDNGQPILLEAPEVEHVMLVCGSTNSLTSFVAEPISVPITTDKSVNLYADLHKKIEFLKPTVISVSPNTLYKFNQLTIHRGEPAAYNGWRYFFRITASNHHKPVNEVRTQSQVYLVDPFKGW